MNASNYFRRLFVYSLLTLLTANFIACKKDNKTTTSNNNNNTGGDFFKGYVNTSVWPHGCILRTNGTVRYYLSFSGGSMSDTANADVSKYEGTYIIKSNDSIYINCDNGTGTGEVCTLKGVLNTAHTSMSGTWVYAAGGITNTLPFSMSK